MGLCDFKARKIITIKILILFCEYAILNVQIFRKNVAIMAYNDRKDRILNLLDINDSLTLHQLVEQLGSSVATIRRDVTTMEEQGLLERYWGGIKKVDTPETIRKTGLKYQKTPDCLERIGRIAAEQLQDNELIFIGSGMTTLAMIPFIERKNIHVITNGIPQLEALNRKNIEALLLCGFYKEYSHSVVGKETVEMLRGYKFDRSFVGAYGIDDQYSPLSADTYEDTIKTLCIKNSKSVYLLASHDKFSRTAYYSIPTEMAKDVLIITDEEDGRSRGWRNMADGCIGRVGTLAGLSEK